MILYIFLSQFIKYQGEMQFHLITGVSRRCGAYSFVYDVIRFVFFYNNQMRQQIIGNKHESEQKMHRYGAIKLDVIVLIYIPLVLFAPCFTYYMAVIKEKQCKPFPHSTITQTANRYPQNIVFRLIMGVATSLFVLIFDMIYRWIDHQAERSGFKKMDKMYYYLMLFANLCYCTAVLTIDGLGNGPLHTPSAVFFFIILEVFIVYATFFMIRLRKWDTSVMSKRSLNIKIVLAIYITAVWIYCLYGNFASNEQQNSIDYSVVVEWNAFFISIFWLFSFYYEWKQIRLVLIGKQ